MTKQLGQAVFGNPVPDYADALVMALLEEIAEVFWNVHQVRLGEGPNDWYAYWYAYAESPIPGIELRPYEDKAEPEPNLQFEDVEIRWLYRTPGRGMSSNKVLNIQEWIAWFQRFMACISSYERERLPYLYKWEDE